MTKGPKLDYDRQRDFVHVDFLGMVLATPADAARWYDLCVEAFTPFGRPLDMIIDLGSYTIKPAAVQAYDDARQRVIARFVRRVYRYNGTPLVRTKIMTSSALHGQAANVYASFDAAVAALLADRSTA